MLNLKCHLRDGKHFCQACVRYTIAEPLLYCIALWNYEYCLEVRYIPCVSRENKHHVVFKEDAKVVWRTESFEIFRFGTFLSPTIKSHMVSIVYAPHVTKAAESRILA